METIPLREYRCECGKLLFKGLLFLGVVEIKCKRCGKVPAMEHFEPGVFALVECDAAFSITTVSGHPRDVFGYECDELLGKQVGAVLPFLRDADAVRTNARDEGRVYAMRSEPLILKDGGTAPSTSYIIPKREADSVAGYRIFTRLDNPQGSA